MNDEDRENDRRRLHDLLDQLADQQGGRRRLAECHGRLGWPSHGVYFFYEDGETTTDGRPRVVRVGTHALTTTSRTTLWQRLRQHRGAVGGRNPGRGDHRGSIFRLHVGAALIRRDRLPDELLASWLAQKPATRHPHEPEVERAVSAIITAMPFTWLAVPNASDGRSARGDIERNAIALLAHSSSSAGWLGRRATSSAVRASGLWNVNHVNEPYDRGFLDRLEGAIAASAGSPPRSQENR
jgi:hypothetical protein